MATDMQFTLEVADSLAEAFPPLLDLDARVKAAVSSILAGEPYGPGKLAPDVLPCNPPDAEVTTKSLTAAGMCTVGYVQALTKTMDPIVDECIALAKAIPVEGVSVTLPSLEEIKRRLEEGTWSEGR